MDKPLLKRRLSPLITSLKGNLGPYHCRTRADGSLVVRRRRSGPGPAAQSPAWEYCQDQVRLLDAYARTMSYEEFQEWGICTWKTSDYHLTAYGEFYRINLRRMLFGMPGLASPPDAFRSKAALVPSDQAFVEISPSRNYHVWISGTKKNDEDFDEDEGDIPPSVPGPNLLTLTCQETHDLMNAAYLNGNVVLVPQGEPPPDPDACWHGVSGSHDLTWIPFPVECWVAAWGDWYDFPMPGDWYFDFALWCDSYIPDKPATYYSHFSMGVIADGEDSWYWDMPDGLAPLNLWDDGTADAAHLLLQQSLIGCGTDYPAAVNMTFSWPGSQPGFQPRPLTPGGRIRYPGRSAVRRHLEHLKGGP